MYFMAMVIDGDGFTDFNNIDSIWQVTNINLAVFAGGIFFNFQYSIQIVYCDVRY
jgi:hypothetical protein